MDADRRKELVQQGKDLKETLAQLEETLGTLQDSLQHEGQMLPNLAHPSVSRLHICMYLTCTWAHDSIHTCCTMSLQQSSKVPLSLPHLQGHMYYST